MNRNVPVTLCITDQTSTLPCAAMLKMIDTMIQPTLSSMMAEARITCPTTRRMKFISRTTIATILTEAIDSAVPRNSDVISRLPGSGSMASGNISPSATPQTKGMTMPMSDAKTAARPVWRTSLRSVSMPVRSSRRSMPNCEIASIIAFCSGFFGNRACGMSGSTSPKNDGPSSSPAINCPITAGWPMRSMASPSRRPTIISASICRMKMTSDGPLAAPLAARAGPATTAPTAISASRAYTDGNRVRLAFIVWRTPAE